eukprot:ANDGO_05295.mRNA.1 carboxylyase
MAKPLSLRGATEYVQTVMQRIQQPQFMAALQSIRDLESQSPLFARWQQLLRVVLPVQLEEISRHGFESTQTGLSEFNAEFSILASQNPDLYAQNADRWSFIMEKCFGMSPMSISNTRTVALSLARVREITQQVCAAMDSEEFLSVIRNDNEIQNGGADVVAKRLALLKRLLPLHQSVLGRHGFHGDAGWLMFQRILIDFMHDAELAALVAASTSRVFQAAGIR